MFAQVIPEFQDSGRFSVLPVLYKNGVMNPVVHPEAADPTMMGVIAILSLAINVVVFAIIWKRASFCDWVSSLRMIFSSSNHLPTNFIKSLFLIAE